MFPFNQRDYRDVLKEYLSRRCEHNPRYSLRALARDLQMSPSRLSEALNGKAGISAASAKKISERLGLGAQESQYFYLLVQKEHARCRHIRKKAAEEIEGFSGISKKARITLDQFQVVSDWYHYAILEFFSMPDFEPRFEWFAKKLDLPLVTIEQAFKRLFRVGLVELKGTFFQPSDSQTVYEGNQPSEAGRLQHRQMLEKAIKSLDEQTIDERENDTLVVAIDPDDFPKLQEKIRRFRDELNQLAESGVNKRKVYAMTVGMFNLTHNVAATPATTETSSVTGKISGEA